MVNHNLDEPVFEEVHCSETFGMYTGDTPLRHTKNNERHFYPLSTPYIFQFRERKELYLRQSI